MVKIIVGIVIVIIVILANVIGLVHTNNIHYNAGDEAQDRVLQKFSQYKKPQRPPTFEEFCYPRAYTIQRQQAFAGDYMSPKYSDHKELLVFHKIGAGKTCLCIRICEKWHTRGRPLVVMPASLIPGFRNELRSPCAGNAYISEHDRAALVHADMAERREILARSDAAIDHSYQIYSYNKFAETIKQSSPTSIVAPIIVIDEVQNIYNQAGAFARAIIEWVEHSDARVVVMSGTPIFDNSSELNTVARLLRIAEWSAPMTPATIAARFAGKVSYFAGAPAWTFPRVTIKVDHCRMSKNQSRWYKSQVAAEMRAMKLQYTTLPNDFYIKSRQKSNIVYPRGLDGMAGLVALTPAIIRNSLATYSCKLARLIRRLRKGQLSFIYTSFTQAGGISAIIKCLSILGWADFAQAGPGRRRFAVFSGEQTPREKDTLRDVYNSSANDDASQIQIIIGSPSIKEGVSLLRTRQVHVLEAYWNHSRLEQIYGRAVRYCSHKTLPKADREVTIYIYCALATTHSAHKADPEVSIDLYMLEIADKKKEEAGPFVEALIDVAVDKYLN